MANAVVRLALCFTLITGTAALNVLMVSVGAAGHVIPMFELAKAMRDHRVTFVTDTYARLFVNLDSLANSSSFRVIYLPASADETIDQASEMKHLVNQVLSRPLFDGFVYMISKITDGLSGLMRKSVEQLIEERFDVIIGTSLTVGVNALCQDANISCVIQLAEQELDIFDATLPSSFSLLSIEQLSSLPYRLYNVLFTVRAVISTIPKLFHIYKLIIQSLPQIPGPFHNTFTWQNILLSEPKCLKLYSMPPTLYPTPHLDHLSKYLGAFIDESSISQDTGSELAQWVNAKADRSVVYVAFGSVWILDLERMRNIVRGLAAFLRHTDSVSILVAFRNTNFHHYSTALAEITDEASHRVLTDPQRVRVENRFIEQKWVLKHKAVSLFVSHCGMGSAVEALFYEKPILCVPLGVDQHNNAIAIRHSGVGDSLFLPPSMLDSLRNPIDYRNYTFTSEDVTHRLTTMWHNASYQRAAQLMSLEMKHAGGVKQAVKEIEHLASLNGNLNRYAPFHSALPFYQRYGIDLLVFYLLLPTVILFQLFSRCCKRNQKQKLE